MLWDALDKNELLLNFSLQEWVWQNKPYGICRGNMLSLVRDEQHPTAVNLI